MKQPRFGTCRTCGEGELVAVVVTATGEVIALCDECENAWRLRGPTEVMEEIAEPIGDVRFATPEEWSAVDWPPLS